MKKQSIFSNLFFQFSYQALVLVVPLLVSPFLTRKLGDTALGNYSYVHTISYFFLIFSMLGIMRYGQRVVAQNSSDKEKLRKSFWSLYYLHLLVSAFFTGLYFFMCFVWTAYFNIYVIDGLYVCSALFDVTWFFYGIENFKSVVIKNGLIKVCECIFIFLFIKSPDDLWIYTLITASGILFGQIILLPRVILEIKPIKVTAEDIFSHLKPLLVFFVAILATTMYTAFDKTLLGLMSTKENVAYYEYSNMIDSVPRILIGVIGTVMFPRACKMANNSDFAGQRKYINYSYILINYIALGSIFGILSLSKDFAIIYFGESFAECGHVMIALSPAILIIGLGEVVRTQYMIPNKMDVQFTISVVLSAILNVFLSITLIPSMGIYGAVVGTVSAELCGLIFQSIICRKFIDFRKIFKHLIAFSIIGAVMLISIKGIGLLLPFGVFKLIILFIVGFGIYSLLALLYIAFFEKGVFLVILNKFKKIIRFIGRSHKNAG